MIRNLYTILVFLFASSIFADSAGIQTVGYKLEKIEKGWNRLELDDDLLTNMSSINTYIRVNLIDSTNDTLEVPFIIESSKKLDSTVRIPVEIINKTTKDGRKYYTLVADSTQIISNLEFSFTGRNSLGKASLEGSNNQTDWFMISDSLLLGERHNSHQKISSRTIYDLQTLYKYYRLSLEDSKSELKSVFYEKIFSTNPKYKKVHINHLKYRTDEEKHRTIYRFGLNGRLPIHYMMIDIQSKFDYSRDANLFALTDSFQTDKGIKYNYKLIETFKLSSLDSTNFTFSFPDHYQYYKLVIENGNDPPLKIRRMTAYRHEYILKARFDEVGEGFIQIANTGSCPYYDIEKFKSRIPNAMNEMKIGKKLEVEISKEEVEPLVTNKLWLWLVMMVAVIVIGYFSLKMLKEEKKK